jgi:GxxExxY protein
VGNINYAEPDAVLDELAHRVLGASIEVHRHLGPGLDEALYETALCVAFGLRGISYQRQVIVDVSYKGVKIGQKRIDLLIENKILVELKAVESIASIHTAQVITYLKITNIKLGLIINFNSILLKDGIRRVVYSFPT